MLDFLQELLTHILPALLAHVAGCDFQKTVPCLAAPRDSQDIVAGDEGKILPLEEERIPCAPRADPGLSVISLLAGDRHDVEPVHGEAEIHRCLKVQVEILILREAPRWRRILELLRVRGEAGERPHRLPLAECHAEWQLTWCSHRASAPRLSVSARLEIPENPRAP